MARTVGGWLEYRHGAWPEDSLDADGWRALVNLRELLSGGDAFLGSLFGIDNHARFDPVAPRRGFPSPASPIARLDFDRSETTAASWVTLGELRAVDWDAEPDLTLISSQRGWDRAVHRTEKYDRHGRRLATDVDAWSRLPPEQRAVLAAEGEVIYQGDWLRVVPRRRRELAGFDWETLWSWLVHLESRWELDPENLRLVLWFD